MERLSISVSYGSAAPTPTERAGRVQSLFGIGLGERLMTVAEKVEIPVGRGRVVLVRGPSGCGKSSLLRAIAAKVRGALSTTEIDLGEAALIDGLPCGFSEALRLLTLTGLGEAFVMLRRPSELSDGQRFRFRIAAALARKPEILLIDEFCSTLDRVTARVIAHNVRRISDRSGTGLVCATCHDDIVRDLQPDVEVVWRGAGRWDVVERSGRRRQPFSMFERITVAPGGLEDWRRFSHLHYRSHSVGIVDRVFLLLLDGEPIGVVVYAYAMNACALRNEATGGRYAGRLTASARRALLNREMRVMQRLVIEPRFRGLGLAAYLLRETMPLLGVRFVECLAVMGGYSGFLQKAGFVCVGRIGLPRIGRRLLAALAAHEMDRTVLHTPQLLERALAERIGREPDVERLLREWWRQRVYIKGGAAKFDLARAAARLSGELTSRPFYFICDLDAPQERARNDHD